MRKNPWIFRVEGGEGGGEGNAPADNGSEGTDNGGEGFKPITSQEELNKLVGERVSRERSKYSDYKDLKSKADKYDELEEASKSELQKAQEAKKALEDQLASTNAALLRRDVAAEHGILDKDDIELFLTGTDQETLTKQAKRLAERGTGSRKPSRSREGKNPPATGKDDGEREAVRSLFG